MTKKIVLACCLLLTIMFNQQAFSQRPALTGFFSTTCVNSAAVTSVTITISNRPAGTQFNLYNMVGDCFSISNPYTSDESQKITVNLNTSAVDQEGMLYVLDVANPDSIILPFDYAPQPITISGPACGNSGPPITLTASQALCYGCTYDWTLMGGKNFMRQLANQSGNTILLITRGGLSNTAVNTVLELPVINGNTCNIIAPLFTIGRCSARPEFVTKEDQSDFPDIKVYPNPSQGQFTINIQKVTTKAFVTIYDISGKAMREIPLLQGTNPINANNLPSGEYNLIISVDDASYSNKIVINK